MHKDERDLLDVLKFELVFLEKGGYGRSPREPWRPRYIFEDSPSCMNYDCKDNPEPCSHCVLTQLAPPDLRNEKIPCRHIPLDALGENLDSLYRYDDQRELEEIVENWLRATIAKLEAARRVLESDGHMPPPAPSGEAMNCTPLFHQQHPKCANPACSAAFHWLGGGKFFRFHDSPAQENSAAVAGIVREPCAPRKAFLALRTLRAHFYYGLPGRIWRRAQTSLAGTAGLRSAEGITGDISKLTSLWRRKGSS